MNPEDFEKGPKLNHPEVVDQPEAVQIPEQVTLRHLLGIINTKTSHKEGRDGRSSADLVSKDNPNQGAATVWLIEKGSSIDHPDAVAQIFRSEHVGESDKIITNYFIVDTPDGLHIKKHIHVPNPKRVKAGPGEELVVDRDEVPPVISRQESEALENELGLNFVSEQEVRDLIKFMDPLDPYKP